MKAQSAIEYLTTYGWMLLAVATVSGVVYSTFESTCVENSAGFTGESLSPAFVSSGEDNFNIVFENQRFDEVGVQEIRVESRSSEEQRIIMVDEIIEPGETDAVTFPKVSGECNTYDLQIQHNISSLEGRFASGSVTLEGDLMVDPPELSSFSATY